jgi:putative hemolysin
MPIVLRRPVATNGYSPHTKGYSGDGWRGEMTEAAQRALTLGNAPDLRIGYGRYQVRFARTRDELDELLHLRFEVFNLELGEGLEASFATRRDRDLFDDACHHLLVEDLTTGAIVGTYRMQTWEMARAAKGFYSTGEFELEALPPEVLARSVEVGRACIDRQHRSRQVLFLLWKGLAAYMMWCGKRYLFGCCSLSSQDPGAGLALYRQLEAGGRVHPTLRVAARPGFECRLGELEEVPITVVEVPPLFGIYLRYGAMVCSPPAIDRAFKTIDYFVIVDVDELDPRTFRAFFGGEVAR